MLTKKEQRLRRARQTRVRIAQQGAVRLTVNRTNLHIYASVISADGSKVLQQDEQLVFRASKDLRIIDRIITLTAQDKDAVFHDSKEGAIAIRMTRALEEPSTKAEIFTDAAGLPTTVAKLDNTGVNGVYLSSEGKVGEKESWSTRAKWMTLSGNVRGEDVCVGIFDHPKNVTYPTYWHCRGYGLFAANPFGPFALVEVRLALGALVLLPFLWRERAHFRAGMWPRLAMIGAINSAIPFLLFAWAAQRSPAAIGAICNAMTVLFAAMVGFLFFGQKIGLRRSLALLVGFVGVVVLATSKAGGLSVGGAVIAGATAALVATTSVPFDAPKPLLDAIAKGNFDCPDSIYK